MKGFSIILAVVYALLHLFDYNGIKQDWFIPITIVLYVILNVLYLYKYRRHQLFCFELFFAISFFLCSLLTPFIFPLLDSFVGRVFISTPYNIIKVYSLSFLGYCCYMTGLIGDKESNSASLEYKITFNRNCVNYSNLLCFLFIVIFYFSGGSRLITLYSDLADNLNNRYEGWGAYMAYAMYAYTLSTVINFMYLKGKAIGLKSLFRKLPKLYLINSFLLVYPMVISGLRSGAVQLVIPLLMMFGIAIKKIRLRSVLLILLAGYIALIYIGLTRSGSGVTERESPVLTLLFDFVSANGANSFFVNYVDNNGITNGTNMVLQVASIIPFMQSILLNFISRDSLAPNSSSFFTDTFMDSTQGGMGTGMIGDIYYSFGFIGIIVLMYFMGLLTRKLSKNNNSPYNLAMLIALSGNAVFAARVEYCFILRNIAYTVIFLFIILHLPQSSYNDNSLCD